jgi:hypothetical protein
MKRVIGLTALMALTGCVASPIVADYNGDSVKIQTNGLVSMEDQRAAADPEALRICRAGGKSRAEHASYLSNPQTYANTHLYLCLE